MPNQVSSSWLSLFFKHWLTGMRWSSGCGPIDWIAPFGQRLFGPGFWQAGFNVCPAAQWPEGAPRCKRRT
jgi:hypothetical protein